MYNKAFRIVSRPMLKFKNVFLSSRQANGRHPKTLQMKVSHWAPIKFPRNTTKKTKQKEILFVRLLESESIK